MQNRSASHDDLPREGSATTIGRVLAVLLLVLGASGCVGAGNDRGHDRAAVRPVVTTDAVPENAGALVQITAVRVQVSEQGPVVWLLAEQRAIPIFVDMTVAGSIQSALSGVTLPRPMTHDLMRTIVADAGGRVTRVVVTLQDRTFFGAVSIQWEGRERTFDSRSSDAVALAVQFQAPIFVPRALLDSAGQSARDAMKTDL